MVDKSHSSTSFFTVQSVLLFVLETIFTFIYKHDTKVRKLSQPLIQNRTAIQCHMFSQDKPFFVLFNEQGILLDDNSNDHTIQLILHLSIWQAIQIFLLGKTELISHLQMSGNDVTISHFNALLMRLNAVRLTQDIWQELFTSADEERIKPTKRRRSYKQLLQHIDQQRLQLKQLNLQLRESQNDVRRLEQRYRRTKTLAIVLGIFSLILLSTLLYLHFQG